MFRALTSIEIMLKSAKIPIEAGLDVFYGRALDDVRVLVDYDRKDHSRRQCDRYCRTVTAFAMSTELAIKSSRRDEE